MKHLLLSMRQHLKDRICEELIKAELSESESLHFAYKIEYLKNMGYNVRMKEVSQLLELFLMVSEYELLANLMCYFGLREILEAYEMDYHLLRAAAS